MQVSELQARVTELAKRPTANNAAFEQQLFDAQRKIAELDKKAQGWITRAEQAVKLGDEALARAALERKVEIAQSLRSNVWPLIESREVKPVVHRVFPLAQAAAAHALMESSTHIGKIMLAVAP